LSSLEARYIEEADTYNDDKKAEKDTDTDRDDKDGNNKDRQDIRYKRQVKQQTGETIDRHDKRQTIQSTDKTTEIDETKNQTSLKTDKTKGRQD
jgi:hypothetical protein